MCYCSVRFIMCAAVSGQLGRAGRHYFSCIWMWWYRYQFKFCWMLYLAKWRQKFFPKFIMWKLDSLFIITNMIFCMGIFMNTEYWGGEVLILCSGSLYRVSHELRSLLRESVPYVKIYRYNPKHLYPKLNGYGDNGQRKVWTSCISAFYSPAVYRQPLRPVGHVTACRTHVG